MEHSGMTEHRATKPPVLAVRKIPRQKRSRRMVEAIMEAAARILEDERQPFTTNHIAERAGVSIGSLYQYFPGVESIMAALIEKHVADERAAAEDILASANDKGMDVMRELLVAFVNAHADAPRLTARLHEMAPAFGLQAHLSEARDAQAVQIANLTGLPAADVIMAVMAVEGVVLATLANAPAQLKSDRFINRLYAIALAPFSEDEG